MVRADRSMSYETVSILELRNALHGRIAPTKTSSSSLRPAGSGRARSASRSRRCHGNSKLDGWTNGVWNQVFSGVVGAPAQCFPAQPNVCGPYTTLASSSVTREAPYLYMDSNGNYNVFVPSVQNNSVGTTWGAGATPGSSIRVEKFFVARPTDSAATINKALGSGMNLILAPGVYNLDQTIEVTRPDTVVLGLGFPTLIPEKRNRVNDSRQCEGDVDLGDHLRRGRDELSGATAGRKRPPAQ